MTTQTSGLLGCEFHQKAGGGRGAARDKTGRQKADDEGLWGINANELTAKLSPNSAQ